MERLFFLNQNIDRDARSWLIGNLDINFPHRVMFKDPGPGTTNVVRLRRWLQEMTFGEVAVADYAHDGVEVRLQNETDAVAFKLGYPDAEWL